MVVGDPGTLPELTGHGRSFSTTNVADAFVVRQWLGQLVDGE